MAKKTVEQILLERSLITEEQIESIRDDSRKKGVALEKLLVRSGLVSEEDYVQAMSEVLGVPYIDLNSYLVDAGILELIPEGIARKHKVIPVFKIGDTLTVAMSDPKDVMAIDNLARKSKCEIEPVLSGEGAILNAIDQYYGVTGSVDEVIKGIDKEKKKTGINAELNIKELTEMAEEPPVIKLVNLIIMQAVKDGASDVHVEPEESALKVRFRVDGLLHEMFSPPKHLEPAFISRIKILSGIDISEKRKPQDGRFNIKLENRNVDMRVSTFPTIYGENIVIRILDKGAILVNLDKLGFSEEVKGQFKASIKRPHGIVLVTGPTGSGKTTTLYSALTSIDSEEKNIITIEDPVEYHLGRIRQSQINPKAGLTFASGLRSILRQDPDVIMVGEIRDKETAEIAVQAALTGHLVFSTLHTNDASGALARLMDMGIESFLISSSIVGILAQRLVRKICPKCAHSYTPSGEVLKGLGIGSKELSRGKGCNFCKNTGYKGRIGIFEFLVINEDIKNLIIAKASSDSIKKKAVELGMKTLRDDGLDKVLKGITTADEVIKATQEE
ncbi:MAG: type II secretion system ATPase GspE [Candidatus Omnitrophica bacterium]|nr:type II secretion system ATPase GspE [Candidatus Omnitrophota bacterium]